MSKLRSLVLVLLCAGLTLFASSPRVRVLLGLPRPSRRQPYALAKRSRPVFAEQSAPVKSRLEKGKADHQPSPIPALADLVANQHLIFDHESEPSLTEASVQFASLPRYLLFCSLLI